MCISQKLNSEEQQKRYLTLFQKHLCVMAVGESVLQDAKNKSRKPSRSMRNLSKVRNENIYWNDQDPFAKYRTANPLREISNVAQSFSKEITKFGLNLKGFPMKPEHRPVISGRRCQRMDKQKCTSTFNDHIQADQESDPDISNDLSFLRAQNEGVIGDEESKAIHNELLDI